MLRQVVLSHPSWPEPSDAAPGNATITLAAPASTLFEIEGGLDAALHGAALSRRGHRTASAAPAASGPVSTKRLSRREARRLAQATSRHARTAHAAGRQAAHGAAKPSRQKGQAVATAHHGPAKRMVQARKKRV